MRKFFTFADDSTDFEKLKGQGVNAVLIKYSQGFSKTIKTAISFGMKIMVELPPASKDTVKVIRPIAGRTFFDDGEITYVSVDDIKRIVKKIGDGIEEVTGFVLPVPKLNGLLWNEKIEREIYTENDDIYDLFDEEKEISPIRWRYFVSAQKYLYENYMASQREILKNYGVRAIFYLGKKELQYDLTENLITSLNLKQKGFCLGIYGDGEFARTEFGLHGGDFVFGENTLEQISQKRVPKDVLLIKPTRGVIERYFEYGRRNRLETPALESSVEGVYWAEKLRGKGYSFDIADETSFCGIRNFDRYKDVLICKSCLFTDREMSKINRLLEKGVRINSSELIAELIKQGEEEWEK